MKKIFSLLSILFLFNSCLTQNKIDKICKTCKSESIVIKDSSWTKQTIKVDSIYIYKEGPTLIKDNPCSFLCDSLGRLKDFIIETNKNGIKQTLQGKNNKLIQKCNDERLLSIIKNIVTDNNRLIKEKETFVKEINKLTKKQNFYIKIGKFIVWFAIILIIILVIYTIIKFKNKITI